MTDVKVLIDDMGASCALLQTTIAKLDLAHDNLEDVKEGTVEVLKTLEICCEGHLILIRQALKELR